MSNSNLVQPDVWSIENLVDYIESEKIVLPRYQRRQVWSRQKQKKLIESVSRGFPIGSLLIYEDCSGGTWQVIDGLQRATAFKAYSDNPLSFADLENMECDSPEINASVHAIADKAEKLGLDSSKAGKSKTQYEFITMAVSDWLPETSVSDSSSYNPFELAGSIVSYYEFSLEGDMSDIDPLAIRIELSDEIKNCKLLNQIKEEIDLRDYRFPVIKYTGPKENLPEIFEKVNNEGSKLSRYDILAAVWYTEDSRVMIDRNDIKDAISHKYDEVQESGFIIEDLNHDDDDYTLFEFLFGLGKVLSSDSKFDCLFQSAKKQSITESFAFTLACITYGLRLSDMAKLPEQIRNFEKVPSNVALKMDGFLDALEESIDFVCGVLSPYIGVKLQTPVIAHTEYQICSYIVRSLIGKYEVGTWTQKDGWQQDRAKLKKALPEHYLYELLTNYWGNAGDSKLYNCVWKGFTPSDLLIADYSKEDWESAFRVWFSEDNKKRQTKRAAVDPLAKTVLKYAYGDVMTASELQMSYDIDHIYPIKGLVTLMDELGVVDGWPMSTVGNLQFLESSLNKKKKEKTLADFYSQNPAEAELIKRFSLCDDPSSVTFSDGWGYDEYMSFVSDRQQKIESLILQRFGY